MGPSDDFRQQRLPLDAVRPVAFRPPWMPSDTPEHQDALRMIREERRKLDEQRLHCIEMACANYREGGSEIRLVKPDTDPRLHLYVNGKCAGVFITKPNGETDFVTLKGE